MAAHNEKNLLNRVNTKPLEVAKRLPLMHKKALEHKSKNEFTHAKTLLERYLVSVAAIKKSKEFRKCPRDFETYMPENTVKQVELIRNEINKLISISTTTNDKLEKVLDVDKHLALNENSSNDNALDITLNFPETPTDEPISTELDEFKTCIQLFELLPRGKYLIIDTRSTNDFNRSRIKTPKCVNIPDSEITNGIIVTRFESYLHKNHGPEMMALFKKRSDRNLDLIILMDWMTNRSTIKNSKHLTTIKNLLINWDVGNNPPNIFYLDGGYKEWLNVYPTYTTNPNVIPPSVMENDAFDEILDDVQYPNWVPDDEIPQKLKKNITVNKNYLTSRENYTNPFKSDLIINNTINNSNGYKSSFSHFDEESVDLTRLSQEFKNIDLTIKKNPSHNNTISKPKIDRSNKPTLSTNNPQFRAVLNLLKKLIEISDDEYTILRELNDIRRNTRSELMREEQALLLELENIKDNKKQLKDQLELMNIDKITMNNTEKMEKNKLNQTLYSIESKIKMMYMHRSGSTTIQNNENPEKQKNMIKSPRENNDVYKEPLKSEALTTNIGLKRSLSSPNLAQVKKSKTENQLEDRKLPPIDRSSKPLNVPRQNIREANNNNLRIATKNPDVQMDPVYRDVNPGITGLKNLGNSCYMNSIIQCLSNTAYLAKYFIDNSYQDDLNTSSDNETQGQIAEEFAQVIKALWRGQYKSIAPHDLKNKIGQYKLQFDTFEQQDSHEFFTFLLDWMHNDLRKANTKLQKDGPLSVAEKEWNKAMECQKSIISELFNGQLRSSISCMTCTSRSITYETFNSLSISLMESYRCTLDDCLKQFLCGQRIFGWACPKCKVPREATKKFDFVKLAPIMVIHLNRFSGTDSGLEKKNTQVNFPINNLNLRPYLVLDPESTNTHQNNSCYYNYNLYAISNHYGSMGGGHYTALCKSTALSKWYKYDDQTVTEVTEAYIKSQHTSAYLLFYSSLHCKPLTCI